MLPLRNRGELGTQGQIKIYADGCPLLTEMITETKSKATSVQDGVHPKMSTFICALPFERTTKLLVNLINKIYNKFHIKTANDTIQYLNCDRIQG